MKGKQKNKFVREVVSWLLFICVPLLVVVLLQSQVFALTEVRQSSMENTLIEGQKLILEKISYEIHKPNRGDIVVILLDDEARGFIQRLKIYANDVNLKLEGKSRDDRLIKRVIAIGGDEIQVIDGYVYINGDRLNEIYTKTLTPNEILSEFVPEGYVYVMGDNREGSRDSRNFGPVKLEQIEGKVIYRLLPLDKMGKP